LRASSGRLSRLNAGGCDSPSFRRSDRAAYFLAFFFLAADFVVLTADFVVFFFFAFGAMNITFP
jgi:hypothetical protein